MTARNSLSSAPPYAVEDAIKRLGTDLRTARLRRNLSIATVAEKIGAGVRAVTDAEKGKPSSGVAVYAALLWTYGMVDRFGALADPATDHEGLALSLASERDRARESNALDNDF